MLLSKIMLSLDLGGTRRLQVHENNEVFVKDLATKKCASSHHLAVNVLSV